MSCYEWERGDFVLPTAAVPVLRDALNAVGRDDYDRARAMLTRIKTTVGTQRTPKDFIARMESMGFRWEPWGSFHRGHKGPDGVWRADLDSDAERQVMHMVGQNVHRAMQKGGRVRLVTASDLNGICPRPTNRTRQWRDDDLTITLDARRVIWEVMENNHACDRASHTALAHAFHKAMQGIRWTRRTGGYVVGNNEYNRDDDGLGGGGNYFCFRYGPLGRVR